MEEESVQTLVDLGLTTLQAKVYLALARVGSSTGMATAKAAKVASQDVYRVLAELQEKGLIEKIVATPNEYRPLPMKSVFSMLLAQRNEQTAKIEKESFEICKVFHSTDDTDNGLEKGNFVLIPQGEPIKRKIVKAVQTAQTSFDALNEFEEGIRWHEELFEADLRALDRGVKIRYLFGKTSRGGRLTKSIWELLRRSPDFELKYIRYSPPARIVIKDEREVYISTTTKNNSFNYPCFWSNNPAVVQVFQQWYDNIWNSATMSRKTEKSTRRKPPRRI